MLKKHQGQPIAIVTSLGKKGIAKSTVKNALQLVADEHNVKLTSIDHPAQQTIPSGIEEIPIFHWEMEGLDILKGKFNEILSSQNFVTNYWLPEYFDSSRHRFTCLILDSLRLRVG